MSKNFRYSAAMEIRGEAAAGIADQWLKETRDDARAYMAKFQPEAAAEIEKRLTPLIAGKYENLLKHERREVRAGRLARLEAESEQAAFREAGDIAKMAANDDDDFAERLKTAAECREMLNSGTEAGVRDKGGEAGVRDKGGEAAERAGDKYFAKMAAELATEREANSVNYIMQIGVVSETGADRFKTAVDTGLIDEVEGKMRARKHRRRVMTSVMNSLIEGGRADQAEAFANALETVPAKKDGGGDEPEDGSREEEEKAKKDTLATVCGIAPDEIGRWRLAIDRVRKAKSAEAERAAKEAEDKELERISLESREALAEGTLDGIEAAAARMKLAANGHKKGTRARVAALEEARRLEKAADGAARREVWNAIVDAAAQGRRYEAPEGSSPRRARFAAKLQEAFDRQLEAYEAETALQEESERKEARAAKEAELKTGGLELAMLSPGAYKTKLADAAAAGEISLAQYVKMRDEFEKEWMSGEMPSKAAGLVDILKREFYSGADYDLGERIVVDAKTGKFGYAQDPDTKKPYEGEDVELEYNRRTVAARGWSPMFGAMPSVSVRTAEGERLTPGEQLELLDWALWLAKNDGKQVSTDPVTGERLDSPKTLNAAAEFQEVCARLKSEKRVKSAREMLDERVKAKMAIQAGFAAGEETVANEAREVEAAAAARRKELKQKKRRDFAAKTPKAED